MTEQEAIQATRLRDAAYEAMMRGALDESLPWVGAASSILSKISMPSITFPKTV